MMSIGHLSRVMLALPLALGLAAHPSFYEKPAPPKKCCGSNCPDTSNKSLPDCCKLTPAPERAAVITTIPAAPILLAALPTPVFFQAPRAVRADVSKETWSPPDRCRLAPSGLSPPRLA